MLESDKSIATVHPYLVVPSVEEAADYYFQAYGARLAERYEDSTGKVWYAILKIYGVPLQLMEPDLDMGLPAKDPASDEDAIAVNVDVTNVDKAFQRALRAGAGIVAEPQDARWGGRTAEVRDPFGHRWVLGPQLGKKDRRRSPLAPQVVVPDVNQAVDFWQRVHGAREARRIRATERPAIPFTVVRLGGSVLQLTEPDANRRLRALPKEGPPSGDSAMVTVIPDDVDEMFDRAMEAGGTPIVEPQDAFWGDRYAEFRDPTGLRVSSCGEQTLAEAVVDPAELQAKLNQFIALNGNPSSPAGPVGVKNVVRAGD
jgi:uncharacterized glyoxalase superfamily protein PhnB